MVDKLADHVMSQAGARPEAARMAAVRKAASGMAEWEFSQRMATEEGVPGLEELPEPAR